MKKVILDTDIGDDIDDAYALCMLLEEGVDILGVTTVYRNAWQRATIASRLVSLWGREVPVYVGEDTPEKQPLYRVSRSEDRTDENGKPMIPHYIPEEMQGEKVRFGAVEFIIDALKKHPHEISLLAIGPLTNLARAIEKDREAFSLVKEVLIMGGNFSRKSAEWNIQCDPEAARTVFFSGVPIRAVGVDITQNCTFDKNMLDFLGGLSAEKYKLLVRMTRIWMGHNKWWDGMPIMHDPLTTETLCVDGLVTFEKGKFAVGLEGELRGVTYADPQGAEIEYAVGADISLFMERLRRLFATGR